MEDRYVLICSTNGVLVALGTGTKDEMDRYSVNLNTITDKVGAKLYVEKIDKESEYKILNSMRYIQEKYSYLKQEMGLS